MANLSYQDIQYLSKILFDHRYTGYIVNSTQYIVNSTQYISQYNYNDYGQKSTILQIYNELPKVEATPTPTPPSNLDKLIKQAANQIADFVQQRALLV